MLLQLTHHNLTLLAGDPAQVDVQRVLQYHTNHDNAPYHQSVYLLDTALAWQQAQPVVQGVERCAFIVPRALIDLTPDEMQALKAVVLAVPFGVPLDLSAQLQKLLDDAISEQQTRSGIRQARYALIDDYILERYPSTPQFLKRAQALGLQPQHTRAVLLVSLGQSSIDQVLLKHGPYGETHLQALKQQMLKLTEGLALKQSRYALVAPHSEGVVVLIDQGPNVLGPTLAASFRQEMAHVVIVAASDIKESWQQTPQAYREAQLALTLRQQLALRQRFVCHADVVPYAVLEHLKHHTALKPLLKGLVAPLQHAEPERFIVLLQTLEAYLDTGSSLKQASEALEIHPKTARYRLDRVLEVLGEQALSDEQRFLYHLAVKWQLWAAEAV